MPLVVLALFILLAGCGEAKKVSVGQPKYTAVLDSTVEQGTFTDARDGKEYKTVKIGSQTWMAENLNYEAEGSGCYKNKTSYCDKYGRLYNWATAMKACPNGWHLPNTAEWDKLCRFVDSINGTEGSPFGNKSPYDSRTAGKYLKATTGWNGDGGEFGNGEDTYGFSALPGGCGNFNYNNFHGVGDGGYWWSDSESEHSSNVVYNRKIVSGFSYEGNDKSVSFSVRCLQGEAMTKEEEEKAIADMVAKVAAKRNAVSEAHIKANGGTFTDSRDKKVYKTTKIGNQNWMTGNLNYEAEGSKCYNYSTSYCDKYGRLYDWATAVKACPSGWHLPSEKEWQTLIGYVQNDSKCTEFGRDFCAGKYLKATTGWDDHWDSDNEDSYGFSALPGGLRTSSGFHYAGSKGYWWSASKSEYSYIYGLQMSYDDRGAYRANGDKLDLFSVRCVEDFQN